MKKKILFITHSFGRTGSEMILFYLLKYIDRNKFEPILFCVNSGQLYTELPNDISKYVSYKGSKRWYKKLFRGILKSFGIEPIGYQLTQIQSRIKADLWYVNTILIPQAHPVANNFGVKIATHIHELLYAYSFIKAKEFQDIISLSDTLVACSENVANALHDINQNNIKLQTNFIDESTILTDNEKVKKLKIDLGLLADDFVWVISGTVAYMKGLDTLIDLLHYFKDKKVKFVWIGGSIDSGLDFYIKTLAKFKYQGQLIFTGSVGDDYYNYMSLGNGFLMLSKEESFSLVILEAAFLGIPIVAVNTGIAKNFIKEGMGIMVDSWNTIDLINAMLALQDSNNYDVELLLSAAKEFTVAKQILNFEKILMEI